MKYDLMDHHQIVNIFDRIAFAFKKFLSFIAGTFFVNQYGHGAVVLETVAVVPR